MKIKQNKEKKFIKLENKNYDALNLKQKVLSFISKSWELKK